MSSLTHLHTFRLVRDEVTSTSDVASMPVETMIQTSTALANTNIQSPNYASGLTGVNLVMDQQLVRMLLISMLTVAFVIFGMRLAQLFTAHLRHIFCLNANKEEQNYWTFDSTTWWPWLKREIIYAPLGRKRHNREIQLSKAVNYGTLPGRVHTILLVNYLLSNLIYCLILPYGKATGPHLLAELRGRSGILATANMIPLVLMAARNNPAIPMLRISFDTFNLFHRWIGRLVIAEGVIHVIAWWINYDSPEDASTTAEPFTQNKFLMSGLFAILAMTVILFQTLSAVRHAFYEIFLHLHIALAITAVTGVYIHLELVNLPALPYIRTVVAIWLVERLVRMGRIAYLNFNIRRRQCTFVTVEALPAEACRVTFQLPRHITIRPGSHVYAYLPSISLWQSHPFSVAWTSAGSEPRTGLSNLVDESADPLDIEKQVASSSYIESQTPTSVSLIVAARSGMTGKLYRKAKESRTGLLHLTGLLEGPYAGHDSLNSFGTVIMFAGGAGITHHLIQIRHLVACIQARTVATRKIVLVWTVRDLQALSWIRPWMDEILSMPGRKGVLSLSLYVTRPQSEADYRSPNSTIILNTSRCDPGKVLDQVLADRVGATMVTVCGPGAFADEVRAAVRSRLHVGCVEMNEESFTW